MTFTGPWFTCVKPNPLAYLRLFCLPYAGGSSTTIYRQWQMKLTSAVEVVPIEIPGRGPRFKEPPVSDLRALAAEVADQLEPRLGEMPYAFFGYSMGSHIAFEVSLELRRRGLPLPEHLFVAASIAPSGEGPEVPLHRLGDEELIAELRQFDGTPPGILDNEKIMRTLLPMIRADFALSETYGGRDEAPFEFPITAYGGEEDHAVSRQNLERWERHTDGRFCLEMLQGGHFFIHTQERELLRKLSAALHSVAKRLALTAC